MRTQRWLERRARPAAGAGKREARDIAVDLDRAANGLPFASSCLVRSRALLGLLRRRGIDAHLRIGVKLEDGALDAHAWVDCEGAPLGQGDDPGAGRAVFESPA